MPGVRRDKAGPPARISPPMQMGYKLPAPARSLAMACGPAWEHRMTTDNHDPFALGGDQRDDATLLTLFREWQEKLRLANETMVAASTHRCGRSRNRFTAPRPIARSAWQSR